MLGLLFLVLLYTYSRNENETSRSVSHRHVVYSWEAEFEDEVLCIIGIGNA